MKKTTNSSPYQFEGRIPLSQAIPLGLQHVVSLFLLYADWAGTRGENACSFSRWLS